MGFVHKLSPFRDMKFGDGEKQTEINSAGNSNF